MQLPAHTDISGSLWQNAAGAFELISDDLGRVKELIEEQLASPVLAELTKGTGTAMTMSYLREQMCSGRMLRPGMVLLAGTCCGKITDKHIRIAAIVELIHNARLLHDGVMDKGQKQQGPPAMNYLCCNESAVLLGDFLLSQVFKMCIDLEPQITDIIAASTARICEGELRQIVQRGNWQLSESEYIDLITEKSGALFGSCCYLGGLLAEAGETNVSSTGNTGNGLADFGRNAGIAFQITDDLFDIIGDERRTGKTLGSNVNKNKLTLAVIHLLRTVDAGKKRAVINSYLERDAGHKNGTLAEMLRRYGSLEYAHNRAQEFVAKAVGALAGLRESDAKDALIKTAGFVVSRATRQRLVI